MMGHVYSLILVENAEEITVLALGVQMLVHVTTTRLHSLMIHHVNGIVVAALKT